MLARGLSPYVTSSMRPPSVLAVSSVVRVGNKVVAAVTQKPVRHLSIPDLAGCFP
jgi:hypothetical protein